MHFKIPTVTQPRRTIGDSIIEGPMNYGASRSEAMSALIMELVRLDPDGLDRHPHQFGWTVSGSVLQSARHGA